MEGNITFTMIKPSAVKEGQTGAILNDIIREGFRITALKMLQFTPVQAKAFYAVHKGRPFYESLAAFMSSGTIVAAVLKKENAVKDFRTLIGATNPADAAEGTIRKKYGISLQENAIHGSDSDENALFESSFVFSLLERY